jgi:hypothetical protein
MYVLLQRVTLNESSILINKQLALHPPPQPALQVHRLLTQKDQSPMMNSQVSPETGQLQHRMSLARRPCLHSLFNHRVYLFDRHLCPHEKQGLLKSRFRSAIAVRRRPSQDRLRRHPPLQAVLRPRLPQVVLADSPQRTNNLQCQPDLPQQVTIPKKRM